MRYWVYINDKVDGPYEEEKLVTLEGFTPETLICSEEIEEGASQEWLKASSIFEFDEGAKTMTRAPLSEEELNTVHGADAAVTSPITAQMPQADTSATQILIEKIDHLTREIEDLKGKLDAALSSAASAQTAALTRQDGPAAQTLSGQTAPAADTVTEEALITNTESLVSHAEKLVAQASSAVTDKHIDFLDEIEIGAAKTESLGEKGGEEVVLRSALDSLYGAKEQTEEEKEATFQDLLSPIKEAQEEPVAQDPLQAQDPAAAGKEEQPAEQASAPAEIETLQTPVAQETAAEEKREEIINEITAPARQDDLILQAIEEAQKEDEAAQEPQPQPADVQTGASEDIHEQPQPELASVQAAPQAQEPLQLKEETQTGPQLELPSAEALPETEPASQPAEKETLDLTDQPQLNIVSETTQPQTQTAQPQAQAFEPAPQPSDALTPMNPETEDFAKKEITETIKELVPGKKLETPAEGIISQADLDEAFTERAPVQEFTSPVSDAQPAPAPTPEQTQQPAGTLPEGKGFYNPNDMTEVELKEGSTYLISDFIPPAESKSDRELLAEQARQQKEKEKAAQEAAAIAGSPEAAQAAAEAASLPQPSVMAETVEEIVPAKKAEHNDITLSKVILENTIKTKRGATMDIKTVPMVQEPADTERLDLSDSELDINTQHDMKAADFKAPGASLTKIILGSLVSLVILALIYVMLAYLELLPAKFNFIKSAPAAGQTQARDQHLNEMLGTPDDGVQADFAQPNAAMPAQPIQMPLGMESQITPQPMQVNAPQSNPLAPMLAEVKNYPMINGQTLEQLVNSRHPAARNLIEWNITTAVEPDNYSVLVKVPPENPQSFKISYRFNYNAVTKTLDPTISDSKNLLDSLRAAQPAR